MCLPYSLHPLTLPPLSSLFSLTSSRLCLSPKQTHTHIHTHLSLLPTPVLWRPPASTDECPSCPSPSTCRQYVTRLLEHISGNTDNHLLISVGYIIKKPVGRNVFREMTLLVVLVAAILLWMAVYSSLAELPWPHLLVMQHKKRKKGNSEGWAKLLKNTITEMSFCNFVLFILFVLCKLYLR